MTGAGLSDEDEEDDDDEAGGHIIEVEDEEEEEGDEHMLKQHMEDEVKMTAKWKLFHNFSYSDR